MTANETDFTFLDLIHVQADQAPERPAIVTPGRAPVTYGQLQQHVNRLSRQLQQAGIRRSDRIALVMESGPEMAVATLALSACAAVMPLNPAYGEDEYGANLRAAGVRAVVVQAGSDLPIRSTATRLGADVFELMPALTASGLLIELSGTPAWDGRWPERAQPDDTALLLSTSGTTARPKLAPLSFRNLHHVAAIVRRALALTPEDRCLDIMPLHHAHGLVICLVSSLFSGGSVAIPAEFEPSEFAAWLEELQPTWYSAAPALHRAILDELGDKTHPTSNRLRFVRSSSSSLPQPWLHEMEAAFMCPVIESYGMTECVVITSNPLPPGIRKSGSVGTPAGPEVAIIDEAGVRLPPTLAGEVVVRAGPEIINAYYGSPDEDNQCFRQGWFHTGDEGYLDEDGYLFLTGRLKDMINRGGEKIAPREIEDALLQHPSVREVVAFPAPHPRLGEEVGVLVVPQPGITLTEADVLRFLAPRLAPFKWPTAIVFRSSLPQSTIGKVRRQSLASELGIVAKPADARAGSVNEVRAAIEDGVLRIGRELLHSPGLEAGDHFLHSGGDSIKAMQLLARVRRIYGVDVSMVTFLMAPTMSRLAQEIRRRQGGLAALEAGHIEVETAAAGVVNRVESPPALADTSGLRASGQPDFSLFFFSANGATESAQKYQLFLDAARFADSHGFKAIWVPERHFHAFGGLYPNPALLAATLAGQTQKIRLRAGAVVLPFHDPLRVAEDWSVVDNLSGGRVELALASGWHANDFVLAPNDYANRKQVLFSRLLEVQLLWSGATISRRNGAGEMVDVRIYPRPLQARLPLWLTCHSDDTWTRAGELGLDVVTTVYSTTVASLSRQIGLYRDARERSGHDPSSGKVALMLHTCVAESDATAEVAFANAFGAYADSFVTLKQNEGGTDAVLDRLSSDERMFFARQLLPDRALVGSVGTCSQRAHAFGALGVDEIACLVDYGIPPAETMISLHYLNLVREQVAAMKGAGLVRQGAPLP